MPRGRSPTAMVGALVSVKDGGFIRHRGLSHQVLRSDAHYITWVCEVYRRWIKTTDATGPSTFPTCLWCARGLLKVGP